MFIYGMCVDGKMRFAKLDQSMLDKIITANEGKAFGMFITFGAFFDHKYAIEQYYMERIVLAFWDLTKRRGINFDSVYHLDAYLRSLYLTRTINVGNKQRNIVLTFDCMSTDEIYDFFRQLDALAVSMFNVEIKHIFDHKNFEKQST